MYQTDPLLISYLIGGHSSVDPCAIAGGIRSDGVRLIHGLLSAQGCNGHDCTDSATKTDSAEPCDRAGPWETASTGICVGRYAQGAFSIHHLAAG